MTDLLVKGGKVVFESEVAAADVLVSRGKIRKIGRSLRRGNVFDARGLIVLPGLMDIHLNGAAGRSFFDRDYEPILQCALSQGCTSIVASFVTSEPSELENALEFLAQRSGIIAGFHLEGPFLNADFAGAHNKTLLRRPDAKLFDSFLTASHGGLKIMTIAPELDGAADVIRLARHSGVIVSVGHSGADSATVRNCGATLVTHLFNAMSKFHHRAPSILDAALLDDRLFCELICDGVHISPDAMRLALKCKGVSRIILASDAMPALGMTDGEFKFHGVKFSVKAGKIVSERGAIGGSARPLVDSLRNFIDATGLQLHEAIRTCTLNPAMLLGLKNVGSIAVGRRANLAIVDKSFRVRATILDGEIVYENHS